MAYRVCVLRAPGTNCDAETAWCLQKTGLEAEVVHVNRFIDGRADFMGYDGLVIPGGFSFGDHVRAGALLGKMLKERFYEPLSRFSEEGRPILGICNGFQILVECGLLPGGGMSAALTTNLSSRFEARWVKLRVERENLFTRGMAGSVSLPVAHGEGRFLMREEEIKALEKRGQVVFRYAFDDGRPAGGAYPANPNGSLHDIAGISNEAGTVLGLMPHPERAFHRLTHPTWTRERMEEGDAFGEGYMIFRNMADYIRKR
ncbi:MAG: phosphoribosylformylglycinamidine synthase I [Methanobacteriota archaeon]|nr:MAG: phosphoribosylformylglycinamidine synthase I [Euryarchaeota archaeon]